MSNEYMQMPNQVAYSMTGMAPNFHQYNMDNSNYQLPSVSPSKLATAIGSMSLQNGHQTTTAGITNDPNMPQFQVQGISYQGKYYLPSFEYIF